MTETKGEGYDLLRMAWVIIANAQGGDWDKANPEWKEAAEKWRDEYHRTLPLVTLRLAALGDPPLPKERKRVIDESGEVTESKAHETSTNSTPEDQSEMTDKWKLT